MKIAKSTLPKSQIELTIEVSTEEMKKYVAKAIREISEHVKIDGFRPGKVPFHVLKNHVPEMEIYQEAANIAINRTLNNAIKQEDIFVIGEPNVHIEKLAPENPLIYKAVLTKLPNITLPAWEKVKNPKKKPIEVTDEEVQKALTELSKMHAKESLKDGASDKGDKVVVDFDILRDKVLIENGHYEKFEVILGEEQMIPGFENELLGLKAGESKEFELAFPKKYYRKDLGGKKATFKCIVKSVSKIEVPEINDALAKKFGEFTTLNELKKKITETIKREKTRKGEEMYEQELLDNVVAATQFEELPASLIEDEKTQIVRELKYDITQNGLKWEDYVSHLQKTEEEIKESYEKPAHKRIQVALIMREIASREKFTATEQEIEKEKTELTLQHGLSYNNDHSNGTDEYKGFFANKIVNRKVIEYLKEKLATK